MAFDVAKERERNMSEKIYPKDKLNSICMDALIIYEVVLEHEVEFNKDGSYPDTFGGAVRKYREFYGTYGLRDWCVAIAKRLNSAWHYADRSVKANLGEYDPSELAYDFEWVPEILVGYYDEFRGDSLDEYATSMFEFYATRDWIERFTKEATNAS